MLVDIEKEAGIFIKLLDFFKNLITFLFNHSD